MGPGRCVKAAGEAKRRARNVRASRRVYPDLLPTTHSAPPPSPRRLVPFVRLVVWTAPVGLVSIWSVGSLLRGHCIGQKSDYWRFTFTFFLLLVWCRRQYVPTNDLQIFGVQIHLDCQLVEICTGTDQSCTACCAYVVKICTTGWGCLWDPVNVHFCLIHDSRLWQLQYSTGHDT